MAEEKAQSMHHHHQKSPKVIPSPSSNDEESPALWGSLTPEKPLSPGNRHRRLLAILGGVALGIILLLVILLILAFTLYKVRDPQMTVESVTIRRNDGPQGGSLVERLLGNSTVHIVARVRNPNRVTYYYDKSVTSIFYDGSLLTETPGPTGKAKPRRTFRETIMVNIAHFHLNDTMIEKALEEKVADFEATTMVDGHVKVFGFVRHRVDLLLNCTVGLAVQNLSIMGQSCEQRVWA